ncbi:MAG: TatD family hydrolase [Alphaproteobacteria bacterium]|nr:TatD family hydrolase [Alphaproteobacteria bacterium]
MSANPPVDPSAAAALPRLFDTHCHVVPDVYGDALPGVLDRARAVGVQRMLCIGSGYGACSHPQAIAVADAHADVWATAGLHPHEARFWSDDLARGLREAAAHPRVVALGEAGLDFFYDQSPRDDQRRALDGQAALAVELGLPLVLHDRDSDGELFARVLDAGVFATGALWHCFTGDVARMEQVVDAGGYISLSGIVTFQSAPELRRVAAAVPVDRLLVETDSPWLAPVPHRGKQNEPAHVAQVAATVAGCRGLSVEELAELTWNNACRLFRLPA